jgi:hypothetical protein
MRLSAESADPMIVEIEFPNGYRVIVDPPGPAGLRDVRVLDRFGRASGHTAVESIAALKSLVDTVRGRTRVVGRREDE